MIVRLRIEFDDNERRAIAHLYGDDRLATWAECRRFALDAISGEIDNAIDEFTREKKYDAGEEDDEWKASERKEHVNAPRHGAA